MPIKSRDVIDADDPRVAQIGHPAPPWLINYADLMTEMVAFFIILYALSAVLNKQQQQAKKEAEQVVKEEKINAEVKMTKEGLQISLEEQEGRPLFESGQAELSVEGLRVLDKLAPIFQKMENEVVVQGHTDDVPISTSKYESNWELSTARATKVVKYLIGQKGIPPPRMSAIGYGEYRPLVPNISPENRAKNRRVVFLVKNPPAGKGPSGKGKDPAAAQAAPQPAAQGGGEP